MGVALRYPDEFEVPTFPAGKYIAFTRWVSTAILSVFLLIVFACGVLLWTQKSIKIHPFLVSIDEITGQWNIVGHKHKEQHVFSTTYTLQESVVGEFVKYWFLVSNQEKINEMLWASCERIAQCSVALNTNDVADECAIYCLSADSVYNTFLNNVVPGYKARVSNNDYLVINPDTLKMQPLGEISDMGGSWQISVDVLSTVDGAPMEIRAYAVVGRNNEIYPKTLGYYIADFNAYRIR